MSSEKQPQSFKGQIGGARPGAGRKPGVPNKINGQLKEMIMTALEEVGGIEYLKTQANENAKTFLLLLGRVLPMQVSTDPDQPFELLVSWASTSEQATSDPSSKS